MCTNKLPLDNFSSPVGCMVSMVSIKYFQIVCMMRERVRFKNVVMGQFCCSKFLRFFVIVSIDGTGTRNWVFFFFFHSSHSFKLHMK